MLEGKTLLSFLCEVNLFQKSKQKVTEVDYLSRNGIKQASVPIFNKRHLIWVYTIC